MIDRKVFLSYRRTDKYPANFIADHLKRQFGEENVFIDVDDIQPGENFRTRINNSIDESHILIALIGQNWVKEENGKIQIQQNSDWIRMELNRSLERKIPILPVILEDAEMPDSEALPDDIAAFADYNGVRLDARNMSEQLREIENIILRLTKYKQKRKAPLSQKTTKVDVVKDHEFLVKAAREEKDKRLLMAKVRKKKEDEIDKIRSEQWRAEQEKQRPLLRRIASKLFSRGY